MYEATTAVLVVAAQARGAELARQTRMTSRDAKLSRATAMLALAEERAAFPRREEEEARRW